MNKLIRSNLYRILCRPLNVIMLIFLPGLAFLTSFFKVIYRDGCDYRGEIYRYAFEWHMIPAIVVAVLLIYVLMYDYFEGRIYEVEMFMGHNKASMLFSKLVSIACVVIFIFTLWAGAILVIYHALYGERLYLNSTLRLVSLFLIYLRLCMDAVFLMYVIRNFFIYVGALFILWLYITPRIKFHLGDFYIYNLTYKYQMSIISSFGGLNKTLMRKVIPYEIIALLIHLAFFYTITVLAINENDS